jgi:hypothetical protein
MRRTAAFCALLLLPACAPAARQRPTAPPAGPAAAEPERYTLVIGQGPGSDVFTERVTRTPTRVESDLEVLSGPMVRIVADLTPQAAVSRLLVQQRNRGDTAVAATVTADFQGDSVFAQATGATSAQAARQAVPAGTVAFVNPSSALMEQIAMRARAMGGDSVQVPVWVAAGGGQLITVPVTFAGEQATLRMNNVEVRLTVDAAGRVSGGSIPQQGLIITRRPFDAPAATPPGTSAP